MSQGITDLWFQSDLPLGEIAERLGLDDVKEDAENYWAWVIGSLSGEWLDIARTHTRPAVGTETRVFLLSGLPFPEGLLADVVARLQAFVPGPISAGLWQYRTGEEFELVLVREFRPPRRREPPPPACPSCGGRRVLPILWGRRSLDPEARDAAASGRVILGSRHESGVRADRGLPAHQTLPPRLPDWACLDCEPGWADVHRLALQDEELQAAKEAAIDSRDFEAASAYRDRQDKLDDRIVEAVRRLSAVPRPAPGDDG